MAGKGGRRSRPWQASGNRGRNRNSQTPVFSNPFAGLQGLASNDGDNDNGEMNAHITERFVGGGTPAPSYPDPSRLPSSASHTLEINDYFLDAHKPVHGGGLWLNKPEIPASSEILPDSTTRSFAQIIDVEEDLRPNKPEGGFASIEEYLGTHYNLLREDAIRPLREAVENVRSAPFRDEAEYPDGASIGVYDPAYITAIVFSNRGLAVRVAFSLGRVKKYVRWEQSKRLITGTLVALSPAEDNFQTKCVIATVAARPLSALNQNPPEIDLFFARPDDIEIDPMRKWVMVECRSSFYEGSRHTMMALQHMAREPFPLSRHLVNAEKAVDPPEYVLKNPFTDMSSLVPMEEAAGFENINILTEWPSSGSHGLDRSQSAALKRILTNQLAIVQGPPGTGKTYVSVVALKILLANMRPGDPPIIVTCQTNHALDQMLRHVAEFEPNFARMGGRSKDTSVIKARTLFELRQSMPQQKIGGSRKHSAIVEIRKLTNQMQMLLSPLEQGKSLLDQKLLVKLGLITQKQAESLDMDSQYLMGISPDTPGIQMEQWMGRCLKECDRPIQPDDFGMEYEEDDFEVEQLKELEAEAFAQDDDFETLKGPYTLLNDNRIGKSGGDLRSDADIREVLRTTQDLNTIPPIDRGTIYNYFLRHTKRIVLQEIRIHAHKFAKLVQQRLVGQWEQDDRILRDQRVIGLTTTGFSKYRAAIANLKPRIVLVEEAAETLEAPVTSACLPSLQHLILVGDHQQLRPRCQVYDFEEEPYYFNLSLFERMVNNGIQMDCLSKQRRMIPEIRKLLVPIYGETIRDHTSVTSSENRPPVEGMRCNSFFFTHTWAESRDANQSAQNEKEADMIVGFFNYLVYNNVSPSKITVLTFYNGQRKLLNKKLMTHSNLRAHSALLNIVTVDSYQGEENDIVILSLVRSNKRRNIGFLSVDNRVCVALSRAKRGFYLFGNAEMLACESIIWSEVIEIMYGKKAKGKAKAGSSTSESAHRVGYWLPLVCSKHGNKTWMEDPKDWEYVNGGCDQDCRCTLPCGHMCLLRCHPFDNSMINCTQKCLKRVESCGHPCTSMCCDPCRCDICERRYRNGDRPTLKPVSRTPRPPPGLPHPPQYLPHQALGAEVAQQAQALPAQVSGNTQPQPQPQRQTQIDPYGGYQQSEGSSVQQWMTYANGGAKEDDEEYIRKMKKHDTKFLDTKFLDASRRSSPLKGSLTAASSSARSAPRLIELSPLKGKQKKPHQQQEQRQEQRHEQRQEQRHEQRQEQRHEQRQEQRLMETDLLIDFEYTPSLSQGQSHIGESNTEAHPLSFDLLE